MTASQQLPDFLIVGAAKAGTTAIHAYLSQHPDIFVTAKKETNFFAYKGRTPLIRGPKDPETLRLLLLKSPITTLDDYRSLFSGAKIHQRLGEASPRYLYYERSPALIKEILGDTKIIVILRNPIDRAYSHFLMNHQRGLEPEASFARAVELEQERIADDWGWDWHYMALGRYHEQLIRYFDAFPRENIKVVFHEQLCGSVDAVIRDLCRFIGVSDSYEVDASERYKVASTAGANDGFLARLAFATETTMLGRTAQRIIPKRLGAEIHRKVQDFVSSRGNSRTIPKLDDATRALAWKYVAGDVARLERMLDRDLSAWRPQSAE